MAEALAVLGLVSSIVQLVDFGSRALARLKQFQTDSHDLSDTLQSIKVRLPLILDSVKRTREQAENGFVTESTAQALTPIIDGCEQGVKKLDGVLAKILPPTGASSLQKWTMAMRSLSYDKQVQQLNSFLESNMGVLTLHHATTATDPNRREIAFRDASQKLVDELAATHQKPAFLVPFPQDPMFVGREKILTQIKANVEGQQHRTALFGIGGVGFVHFN